MAGPIRCSYDVPGTSYSIEVDVSRWDCNREEAHCHVCRSSGSRIAQVWLRRCVFETIPREISNNDQRRILDAVEYHRYELERAYENNRQYGAD